MAFAEDQPASPEDVVAVVQDERIADVEAVQAAAKNAASAEARAAILADFQQRESQRATEAGAASLQAELARQATANAGAAAQQPATTVQRDINASGE